MKSLLKQALQRSLIPKSNNFQDSNKIGAKKNSLYKNRKEGHLKRVRNEQRQKSRNRAQSWKTIQDPKKRRKRKSALDAESSAPVPLTGDAQMFALGRQLIEARRALTGTKQKKQTPKKARSILFRDVTMDIKDIICS